jgi:hypothetical protein
LAVASVPPTSCPIKGAGTSQAIGGEPGISPNSTFRHFLISLPWTR